MLEGYEYYIDPEEDEVFFAPLATDSQLEAIERRRRRKTMLYPSHQPNGTVPEEVEDKENVPENIQTGFRKETPSKISVNPDSSVKDAKRESSRYDLFDAEGSLEEESSEVDCSVHNTTPCDEEGTVNKLIDVSLCQLPRDLRKLRKTIIFDREVDDDTPVVTQIVPPTLPESEYQSKVNGLSSKDQPKPSKVFANKVKNKSNIMEFVLEPMSVLDVLSKYGCHSSEKMDNSSNEGKFDEEQSKPVEIFYEQDSEIVSYSKNETKVMEDTKIEQSEGTQGDFDDIKSLDESGADLDVDYLYKDCVVNDSLVSWASVDVNAQLESLTSNLDNLLFEENEENLRMVFHTSSTPRKSPGQGLATILRTPQTALKADSDGGYLSALSEAAVAVASSVKKSIQSSEEKTPQVPSVVVTVPTPEQEAGAPSPVAPIARRTPRLVRLVYHEEQKKAEQREGDKEGEEGSSSSASFKSFESPHSTPFVKPINTNIPKSGKRSDDPKTRIAGNGLRLTDQKAKIQVSETRGAASASKIPTCGSAKIALNKNTAAKSLQFSHIESPVTKYIHQKSTPLVCNIKPKKMGVVATGEWKTSHPEVACAVKSKKSTVGEFQVLKTEKKDEGSCLDGSLTSKIPARTPQHSVKPEIRELPPARYQKGIPVIQDKPGESRLPRLGHGQLRVIKPLSPRVVKHNLRQCDVSVLVSGEAKLSGTPKKQ